MKTKLMMRLFLGSALVSAVMSANAAVLLPDQSIYLPNDLTVVQDGGVIYQYLDLTVTYGVSASSAIADHASNGFRWATASDMATLLSAFNIKYSIAPGNVSDLTPADGSSWTYSNFTAATSSFLDHLGYDPIGAISASYYAAGFINDLPMPGRSTYLYINSNAGLAFVSNQYSAFQAAGAGTFLVRNAVSIPEPTTQMLMILGLTSIAYFSRSRKSPRRAA
mgnify:CR=1 FL=1